MHLKMLSGKWWPFCLSLNGLSKGIDMKMRLYKSNFCITGPLCSEYNLWDGFSAQRVGIMERLRDLFVATTCFFWCWKEKEMKMIFDGSNFCITASLYGEDIYIYIRWLHHIEGSNEEVWWFICGKSMLFLKLEKKTWRWCIKGVQILMV